MTLSRRLRRLKERHGAYRVAVGYSTVFGTHAYYVEMEFFAMPNRRRVVVGGGHSIRSAIRRAERATKAIAEGVYDVGY